MKTPDRSRDTYLDPMILEWVCKPNPVPVPGVLERQAARATSGAGDGHSSRRRITPLARATYPEVVAREPKLERFGRAVLVTPPYLVLHHGEFA
jgi:hypothetical protein